MGRSITGACMIFEPIKNLLRITGVMASILSACFSWLLAKESLRLTTMPPGSFHAEQGLIFLSNMQNVWAAVAAGIAAAAFGFLGTLEAYK